MSVLRGAVVSLLSLSCLAGCDPECVDKYDCRTKGINLICQKNRCVPDPNTPFVRPGPGPDYGGPIAGVELTCDGQDEDRDGTPDVSRVVPLAPHDSAFAATFATSPIAILAGTVEGNEPHLRVFNVFGFQMGDVALGRQRRFNAALPPGVAVWNDAAIAAWARVDGGFDELRIARFSAARGPSPTLVNDFGDDPRWVRVTNIARGPRPLVSADGGCALIYWSDSCDGWHTMGATIDFNGTVLAGPMGLDPGPPNCNTDYARNVLAGTYGFIVVGVDRLAPEPTVVAKTYDCGLQENTALRTPFPTGSTLPQDVRVAAVREGPDGKPEVLLTTNQFSAPTSHVTELRPDGGTTLMSVPAPTAESFGTPFWLPVGVPMFVEWSQGSPFTTRAIRKDAFDLDITMGATSPADPNALHVARNVYAIAGSVPQPDGGEMLSMRYFCAP